MTTSYNRFRFPEGWPGNFLLGVSVALAAAAILGLVGLLTGEGVDPPGPDVVCRDLPAPARTTAAAEFDQYESEIERLQSRLAKGDGDCEERKTLAYVLGKNENHAEAEGLYARVLEQCPDPLSRGRYAGVLCALGKRDQGRTEFEKATGQALQQSDERALVAAAVNFVDNCLRPAGDFDEALDVLHSVEEQAGLSEVYYGVRGEIRRLKGDSFGAAKDFEQVLLRTDLEATDRRAFHNNYGIALGSQLGNEDLAEEQFLQALAIDPTLANTWLSLGETSKRRGEFDEANACYRRAREHDPTLEAAYYNPITAACMARDCRLAVEILRDDADKLTGDYYGRSWTRTMLEDDDMSYCREKCDGFVALWSELVGEPP